MPRCDMHVHSMYSRATGYWFLRALQAPESFTPPELLYEKACDRGMDFVTITDINTIDGVMRIIDQPGVFTGEEIRTFLHGSRAAVHILAYGFDPCLTNTLGMILPMRPEDIHGLIGGES